MKEVFIKHKGLYVQEFGESYVLVPNIEQATDQAPLDTVPYFVKEYMGLEIDQIELVIREHTYTDTQYVMVGELFLPISECELCNVCNKWFSMNELHYVRYDMASEREYVCDKHYEIMDFIDLHPDGTVIR